MQSGGMAYVEYAGYAGVNHARLLLSLVAGSEWVILTPDHDIYVEDLRPENPDFSLYFSIREVPFHRGYPQGVSIRLILCQQGSIPILWCWGEQRGTESCSFVVC